ncbi:putative ORFan [Tupanvirus deep ocean]|uniref:ORFan n=2 Tax=Tupanvirus TaxID=2094720 RepID=A0AC62A9Y2_9VIRU|nr:putative ORFan [Tupanvirus deep ocean]QKU34574.1 putative ORFan [Tupanvirus deep ocean]
MNKGFTSYYYMSSSNVTTYNENGCKKSKQQVRINDNGNKDHYYKESVVENGQEKIIREEGNKKYEAKELFLTRPGRLLNWNSLFDSFWFDFPRFGNFLLDEQSDEQSDEITNDQTDKNTNVISGESSGTESEENNNDNGQKETYNEVHKNKVQTDDIVEKNNDNNN